jgi:hypothetical protein
MAYGGPLDKCSDRLITGQPAPPLLPDNDIYIYLTIRFLYQISGSGNLRTILRRDDKYLHLPSYNYSENRR